MSLGLTVPALLLGLFALAIVLWALFLRLGLRWAKAAHVTWRRVFGATVVAYALSLAFSIADLALSASGHQLSPAALIITLLAAILVPVAVIAWFFRLRPGRAFKAWLPTLLAQMLVLAFGMLVVQPYLLTSFVISSNSMAPTLVGQHYLASCPDCGEPAFGPAPLQNMLHRPPDTRYICSTCFHVAAFDSADSTIHPCDRFFVARFLTLRRWDIVTFFSPGDSEMYYVMRVVGLPGETIHIEDGAVWVNGQRQPLPESLRGLVYLEPEARPESGRWGAVDTPAKLGTDEYFVLSDSSHMAFDSRYWPNGAPGHPPYAVPASHITGVATQIYWPPDRWRALR